MSEVVADGRCAVGTSIFQLVKADNVAEVRQALKMCAAGSAVTVRYQTKSRRGYVQVVTRESLVPGRSNRH